MNKILLISTALLLSGCAAKLTQLNVPTQIEYKDKHYVLAGSQDLETIARYVYIAKPDTLEHWQSQIEVLFDRNHPPRTIQERIALRERIYRNTGINHFYLESLPLSAKKADELRGYVLYAPSNENPTWQVNVMKGRDLPQCGYVQFQYAQKVQQPALSPHLNLEKVKKHLQKYVVEKERKRLQDLTWQWFCQK